MSGSRTVDQIESELDKQQKLMFVHKSNGNYAEAQVCRLKIEQLQKNHEARSLYQMNIRHKQENKALLQTNNQEIAVFNDFWNKREIEIKSQEDKMESEMLIRHKTELTQSRKELEILHSPKVKQSSQLLNLRKMEEHMVKQNNFADAHKVQQQIFQLQKQQKGAWLDRRDQKIETALTTLKGKQSVQLTSLKKRYKTLLDECLTEMKIEEERLLTKHNNLLRDQKSQHEKQVLSYKGQFRSKGGKDSPLKTRSSFHS